MRPKNAYQIRTTHLEALAHLYAQSPGQQNAHAILRHLIATDAAREIYHHCKNILKPNQQHHGLTRLEVPAASCIAPTDHRPQPDQPYSATSSDWISLNQKELIKAHLMHRNITQYKQANATPFGSNDHGHHLGFHGTSPPAQQLLQGTYNYRLNELTPASLAYLHHLQYPKTFNAQQLVNITISNDEVCQGFINWRETTSTSPSGHHLSHYRSIIFNHDATDSNEPLQVITHMMNIPFQSTIVPEQWTTTVTICLEKKPGIPQTDKIRIIHLYEADYN